MIKKQRVGLVESMFGRTKEEHYAQMVMLWERYFRRSIENEIRQLALNKEQSDIAQTVVDIVESKVTSGLVIKLLYPEKSPKPPRFRNLRLQIREPDQVAGR